MGGLKAHFVSFDGMSPLKGQPTRLFFKAQAMQRGATRRLVHAGVDVGDYVAPIKGNPRSYSLHFVKPRKLLFVQKGIDVSGHFGAVPILGADDFAVEAAAAGDDVGVRIHGGAVGEGNLFGGVAIGGEGDVVSLQKIFVGLRVVVHADAEDRAA